MENGLNRRIDFRNNLSYLYRLWVKIVETMDDKNGTKTQIRRRHLKQSPIFDKVIPRNGAEKHNGTS